MNSAPIGSDTLPPLPTAETPLPLTIRIAGFGMIVIAIMGFALMAMMPESGRHGSGGFFDLLCGAMLLAGKRSMLGFSRFRAWVGLLIGTPMMLAMGGIPDGIGQAIWCIALLALLVDRPSKPRLIFGGLLMFATLSLVTIGALVVKLGPTAFASLAYHGQTQPLPAGGNLKIPDGSLSLQVPQTGWEQMKPEAVKAENPLFELWVLDPNNDLHVAVLPEALEEPAELKDYRDAVVSVMKGSKLVHEEDHRLGKLLRFHEAADDIEIDRFVLVAVRPKAAYQVHAWCRSSQFGDQEKNFRSMLDSIQIK